MIAGMFASCSLDSMSLTEKDTTNFPKTAEDANQALAAIYQNLNNVNAFPQQSFLYNSLLACDDMLGGGGPNRYDCTFHDTRCYGKYSMVQIR